MEVTHKETQKFLVSNYVKWEWVMDWQLTEKMGEGGGPRLSFFFAEDEIQGCPIIKAD